jgi:hypothetical protein
MRRAPLTDATKLEGDVWRARAGTTTDQETIRRCAEARGSVPARVRGTENGDDLYQDEKTDGETSTFFKLLKREGVSA